MNIYVYIGIIPLSYIILYGLWPIIVLTDRPPPLDRRTPCEACKKFGARIGL